MNFKKFISGVSALTIAASAFAGMAVTANAATKAVTKYTLPAAVTGTQASENPSWTPGSTDIDFGTDVSSITSGVIYIDYQTNVTVDLTNGTGNRPGYITLEGLNDSSEAIAVLDYYSNTSKSNNKAKRNNYAIGGRVVDDATATSFAYSDTTTKTYNFSLAIDLDNNTISGTITGDGSDTAAATISETALDVSAITGFNLGSTTSNVQKVNSATVYVKEDVEYSITTKPYAKVTIGDAVTYSNASGVVDLTGVSLVDGQTITVEKTGYVTATDTVDLQTPAEIPLNAETGIVYYEDFSYVNDNFAFTDGSTVTDGEFHNYTTKDGSASVTLPETVNIAGTVVTMRAKVNRTDRAAYLTFGPISIYFNSAAQTKYGNNAVTTAAGEYRLIQVYMPTSNDNTHRPIFYVDGVRYHTTDNARVSNDDKAVTTFGYRNVGNALNLTVDYIKVESLASGDTEPTATVTIADGENSTSISYLSGTSFTLPAAAGKDGYTFEGWSDGTNTYAAGTALTADATKTYTAVYEEATTEDAFVFTKPLTELMNLNMYVTRSSDNAVSDPVAVSSLDTTTYSGTGDANLAIIFENIPESWGTLSVVLK